MKRGRVQKPVDPEDVLKLVENQWLSTKQLSQRLGITTASVAVIMKRKLGHRVKSKTGRGETGRLQIFWTANK